MRERYDSALFNASLSYHPSRFDIRSSQKVRVLQSAYAFTLGFLQDSGTITKNNCIDSCLLCNLVDCACVIVPGVAITSVDMDHDPLLRFHKLCPRYSFLIKHNHSHQLLGPYIDLVRKHTTNLAESICQDHQRLSLCAEFSRPGCAEDLSCQGEVFKKLESFWEVCQMNMILTTTEEAQRSLACFIFKTDSVNSKRAETMEYLFDAKHHYMKGAGTELNVDMSCALQKEIGSAISSALVSDERPPVWLRFAHAETLTPVIAKLFSAIQPFSFSSSQVSARLSL